ncbi:MAG: M67 family metallopeptidase [Rhodospirillales bacterium]|nr:M67 family metallopeptidase [Rhodospirillales bacterium]
MITIPAPLLMSITEAAEAAFPMECCGLLVGNEESPMDFEITRVEHSANYSEGDQRRSFLVDPKVQFDLMRDLGDGPEKIVGNFHSHPGGRPEPSEHDRQSVYYPDHVWVIVGVKDGSASGVAAFVFDRDDEDFREIGLNDQPYNLENRS